MKLSDQRVQKIIGWSLIVGVTGNLLMCLNLYQQVISLNYQLHQLETDSYAAIQSLSTDVHTLKYSKPFNKTGEFE